MVAPRIIWRYILRETLIYTALGLAAIGMLLVVGNILRLIEDMVGAGVGLAALGKLVLVILPSYFSYAIPTALVFGILLTFGRMSMEGEIIAMRASGISVRRLLPPVLALGCAGAAACGWLLAEAEPRSHASLRQLVRDIGKSVRWVEPGEFRGFSDRTLLYVHGQGDESCPLEGVMIGDFSDPRRPLYITGRCGSIQADASDTGTLAFDLVDGAIQFDESDGERFRHVRFERMTMAIDVSARIAMRTRASDYTTLELAAQLRNLERGSATEISGSEPQRDIWIALHRRVAFPLASLVLAIVAVPLGIQPLRAGRSAGALTAIGVVGAYWLLTSVGELAAEEAYVSPAVGMWLPNVIVLLLGLALVRRSMRVDA
jgi:lipopolysaccharide export system permease protein